YHFTGSMPFWQVPVLVLLSHGVIRTSLMIHWANVPSYQDLQRRLIEYWCQDSFRLDLQRTESSRLNRFPWPQIPKHLSKLVSLVSLRHWRHPLRMVCPLPQVKSYLLHLGHLLLPYTWP